MYGLCIRELIDKVQCKGMHIVELIVIREQVVRRPSCV
jgi:hypothetical protein